VVSPVLPIIKNIEINNSTAIILMAMSGNYEFSLDMVNWQSSNTFTNLKMKFITSM
jgi:hypothetical protein